MFLRQARGLAGVDELEAARRARAVEDWHHAHGRALGNRLLLLWAKAQVAKAKNVRRVTRRWPRSGVPREPRD
jgi:hypothetical protein